MELIHHVVEGTGERPVILVHGFACAHDDWSAQIADLSPHHRTVAVDLRGHGNSPGNASDCSIRRYGSDVAEVMRTLGLPSAVLVGHSMGCRVVVEAALAAPQHVAGVVLVDGSQFADGMEAALTDAFASPDGYPALCNRWFVDMFTIRSDPNIVASVVQRALSLPQSIGEKLLIDLARYDTEHLTQALSRLSIPVMAIQSTYSNEKRERRPLVEGQMTPYLEMLRDHLPSARIEIIPETGHFPQIDNPVQVNQLLRSFLAAVR